MPGLLIIDGADGTHKSTLARKFAEQAGGGEILHMTYRWKHPPGKRHPTMYHYHTGSIHYSVKKSNRTLAILDRSWATEEVYAGVYRSGTLWPMAGRMIDRVVQKHAGVYVYCVSDPEEAARNHAELSKQREEMYTDRMDNVASGFIRIADRMKHRQDVFVYRTETDGRYQDEFVQTVLECLKWHRDYQYAPALDPSRFNVLGHSVAAKVLFVGDVTNPKLKRIDWPFYDHGNSSLFMSEALDMIGFDESSAMWTNANNGDWHVDGILSANPHIQVIALGTRASAALTNHHIEHRVVHHPQAERRFGSLDAYASDLRATLGEMGLGSTMSPEWVQFPRSPVVSTA